jgi:hypothetical protein
VSRGLRWEHDYYKGRAEYDWRKAQKRGLTPQEFYGSPAAGQTPQSGATQTLGNAASQENITRQQIGADVGMQMAQLGNQVDIAEIGADAQKYSADQNLKAAEISSGRHLEGTKYAADKAFEGIMEKIQFDEMVFKKVTLPQAAKVLRKTEQEIQKLINDVATSDPAFVRMLKLMTMGPDNVLSLVMSSGVTDISDPEQLKALDHKQRAVLIEGMMAINSRVGKELAGAQWSANKWLDSVANALEKAIIQGVNAGKPGIRSSGAPPKDHTPKKQAPGTSPARFPSHHRDNY